MVRLFITAIAGCCARSRQESVYISSMGMVMHTLTYADNFSPFHPNLLGLFVYAVLVAGVMLFLLLLAAYLGDKKSSTNKSMPYESGIIPTGSARLRFPVPFYLVAIFFLIFDVEGAFIFSYAVSCEALGWSGWLQITFFIVMLMLGLVYIWNKGGLEWGPLGKKASQADS